MQKLFSEFDLRIRLNDSKRQKLKTNRNALRDKIENFFKEKGWTAPIFHSQGSFPLKTNLNPIKTETADGDVKEKYDLDDGVYFMCVPYERKDPSTYHDRIKKAVNGHAENIIDKNTCVRVVYADGHHIDLPSYWLEKDGNVPQLAHKSIGYVESDPIAFKKWVDEKFSTANSNGQLRRLIRYLKAWKNYRQDKSSSLKLPSGFILTILACQCFSRNESDNIALENTVTAIIHRLNERFTCYRPTIPQEDELLSDYSKDIVLNEFVNFFEEAEKARNSSCEKMASQHWRKVFGDRFPLGQEHKNNIIQSTKKRTDRIPVSAPWLLP